jgi:2-phosphosulfolactate phosphatase
MLRDAVGCFDQEGYRVRLAWGRRGARSAAARGDTLVVVDTLSFSTAVITAVSRGAVVWPCAPDDVPAEVAARHGAELAVGRGRAGGRFTLSPLSLLKAEPGTRVVLPSPNGSTCSRYAQDVPLLLIGAPLNAAAVVKALASVQGDVTVLACGERWADDDTLRVALEDYLGAGAILAGLGEGLSPEAEVCAAAFRAARPRFRELLRDCGSGRELRERAYGSDVEHAAGIDTFDVVPVLRDGAFRPLAGGGS